MLQKHVTLPKLYKIGQHVSSIYGDHYEFLFISYEQLANTTQFILSSF